MHRKSTASNGGGLKMKRLLLLLVAVGVLGAAFMASTANAAVGITKWESLTCKENADKPTTLGLGGAEPGTEESLTPPAGQCTGSTAGQLFTQAGGHPNYGI